MDLLLNCKVKGVRIEEGESFFEDVAGRIPLSQLRPSWMIFADGFCLFKIQKMLKRLGDVITAVVGLTLTIPVFLLVPIIIKLDSPGPVFFRQKRVGEYKSEFTMIKFRTMKVARDSSVENKWSISGEERITKVGAFLRKSRLDEIPQLINVLKGEMSLVGPRPDIPFLMEQLDGKVPYYALRYSVKPGITGWAQIKYHYVASVKEGRERHEYDLYYIKNLSVFLDAWIMLKTVQVMIGRIGGR
jgi:exopolysaccharide biosynthesis polyprenyl glycosylphosphotransferase